MPPLSVATRLIVAAAAGRPVDGRSPSDPRLPFLADAAEIVGEVVGGAAAVAAVDDGDVGSRNALALVELPDRRVVPLLDLPEEDVCEHRAFEPDAVRAAVEPVGDRRRREGTRDLEAALARR